MRELNLDFSPEFLNRDWFDADPSFSVTYLDGLRKASLDIPDEPSVAK